MKIRPLIVGKNEQLRIDELISFARNNRFTLEQMKNAHAKWVKGLQTKSIGDDPSFRCELPLGYRVVYSEEFHPYGLMRHISVSLEEPYSVPTIPAVETLMILFKFRNSVDSKDVVIFSERCNYCVTAINVLERLEEIPFTTPSPESIN